jgi:ammonia channel protein AmtB
LWFHRLAHHPWSLLPIWRVGAQEERVGVDFPEFEVAAVTMFQWMFWGYSLAYSRTAGPFIGDLANFGMRNVRAAPSIGSPYIPEIVFCLYQMLFCACTVEIVIGGSFERGRIIPSLFFWLLLGNDCLLPHCVLDMESEWMVI